MTPSDFIIREINPNDNIEIAQLIRSVLIEFGAPKTGTAFEDKATDTMYETYLNLTGHYYVIEYNSKIVGGAGYAKLEGTTKNICELQKMYLLPITRGKGLGSLLIKHCLNQAKRDGFEKCYLETMPFMIAAQTLYKKNGFKNLDNPMGNTGHYSCNVWMIKDLK